jgi:hypothetical protein
MTASAGCDRAEEPPTGAGREPGAVAQDVTMEGIVAATLI